MRIVHVSWLKRSAGELGGVEKFAELLGEAVTAAGHDYRIIAWADHPAADRYAALANPDKALVLGAWLEGEVDFDIAVSDGYWGAGVTAHPVVPVIHGTWAGFHEAMGATPSLNPEVRAQDDAFKAVNAFPVACAPASARELHRFHRIDAYATVLHGVHLDVYSPMKIGTRTTDPPPVVLHAATNDKKGRRLMPTILTRLTPDFYVRYLDARAGEEPEAFQRGDLFLHPSKHEGNAYALLEALATGLPIITTPVGLFADIPDNLVGRILPAESTIETWCDAIREAWGDGVTPYRFLAGRSRRLATQIADFNTFAADWLAVLGAVQAGASAPATRGLETWQNIIGDNSERGTE